MALTKPFTQLQLLATKTLVMKDTKPNRTKVADELDVISTSLRTVTQPPKGNLTVEELHATLNLFGIRCSKDVIIRALQHEWNDTDRIFPRSNRGGTRVATYREAREAVHSFWDESIIYKGKKCAKHEPTGTLYFADEGTVV